MASALVPLLGMTYEWSYLSTRLKSWQRRGITSARLARRSWLHAIVVIVDSSVPYAHRMFWTAIDRQLDIYLSKLHTCLRVIEMYPGLGSFLSWFLANGTDIESTSDWVNRVPPLENT